MFQTACRRPPGSSCRGALAGPRCQRLHSADTQCLINGGKLWQSGFVPLYPYALSTVRMRKHKTKRNLHKLNLKTLCIIKLKTWCVIATSKKARLAE